MKKIIASAVLVIIMCLTGCINNYDALNLNSYSLSKSIEDIVKICGLRSDAEQNLAACTVNVDSKVNPYDVVYDYGAAYNAYVNICDWSLVIDAEYYKSEFPLLAWQYNNDEALLLKHFQTVGIHEGRQGSRRFNVGAYKHNCRSVIRDAFGDDYEGYYFYYMLNHDAEKFVNAERGRNFKNRYKLVLTALQTSELEGVNGYRAGLGTADLKLDPELMAFANKRAYINAHDGYRAHEWFDINSDLVWSIFGERAASVSENTCEHYGKKPFNKTHFACYRSSESHYAAMTDPKFDIIGCSNNYRCDEFMCQFDCFVALHS